MTQPAAALPRATEFLHWQGTSCVSQPTEVAAEAMQGSFHRGQYANLAWERMLPLLTYSAGREVSRRVAGGRGEPRESGNADSEEGRELHLDGLMWLRTCKILMAP